MDSPAQPRRDTAAHAEDSLPDQREAAPARTPRIGLYDPNDERDACGFGLIAQLDDAPSAALVQRALVALERMTHRGGVAADGLSGDGCGLLIKHPDAFLRTLAAEAGIALGQRYASGLVFLPHDEDAVARIRKTFSETLRAVGLAASGWRKVPVDERVCGAAAKAAMPRIEQLFVVPVLDVEGARMDSDHFAHALYLARRRAEQRLRPDFPELYVVSLCADSIGYKGMVLPRHLATFYPDLARPELASSAVVFHQRFSTNTSPRWPLAQPFRLLAHNGEINTIAGNRLWARARAHVWRSDKLDPREFDPPIEMDGSDSQSLDAMLELLQAGGMDLLKALRILIPPATQSLEYKDPDLLAFYEYYGINSEPWDGPAGIVAFDGRYAACTVDRNGLRPARWQLSDSGEFMVASEAGVWDIAPQRILAKGKLGPGQMIAADLKGGRLLDSDAIDAINRVRAPYKQWLKQGMTYLHTELVDPNLTATPFDPATLAGFQKLFQLTREEREQVLRPLAETEQEAVGSMGDDIPMATLSLRNRPLYDRFRQAFAQVTNPPIDSLREDCVMSLGTQIGPEGNLFADGPEQVRHVMLNSPVLSQRKQRQLLMLPQFRDSHRYIDLNYTAEEGLRAALQRLCGEAENAARDGIELLILSDRRPRRDHLLVHALLATGAVHRHLVNAGLRCASNLIVETGTARDPHHIACLIGYGATAVYPYLAYQTLHDLGQRGILKTKHGENIPDEGRQIGRSYRRGIKKGLLKIISKMGISTIGSYRGAQLFEIVGLDAEVVEMCFAGTPSRIGGAGFAELQAETAEIAARAWDNNALPEIGGLLQYTPNGEYHQYNPDVVTRLQRAVRSGKREDWNAYADAVNLRPAAALRDLLEFDPSTCTPIPLEEVEPVSAIVKRFDTAAMSLGALSPEAHEALAIAMNRLGGRSNSGEGGEDPLRYGTDKVSKIKQVASGRFGVTPEYLINAEVLQIKVAQGAKPGEGGQLPGHKVNALIARLRYARPGIGLISPPPHHDIYSIEDLAQLIFDLRQVNPDALISVKLVAHAGVGTIASGVAKAGADLITISGHDGGTGASPISSIRYAGTPWELGLCEARQSLLANGLRERVIVQADGGLKTGLDVIKAALLGAESFGFGTAPMIALGCKYLRICHLNNCATGVATQDDTLREEHFTGLPERVEHFFRGLAEEVRELLAQLGARSLGEIVGRTDLLRQRADSGVRERIDLAPLLASDGLAHGGHCGAPAPVPAPEGLSAQLEYDLADAIAHKRGGSFSYPILNTDRTIGARLSGRIARLHGNHGMRDAPISLAFEGAAGQSFGAFLAGGLHLELTGEANDYVGKGMADGRIVIRPPQGVRFVAQDSPILGNTCLYGATGGELFAAGRAGERFAVRNSGATAVVEGAGDHCCEYMTGGVVAVLGRIGQNFGAGFTGGMAYVLDRDRDFVDRYNHELIDILRINSEGFEHHRSHLLDLLETHQRLTGSAWAQTLMDDFRGWIGKFWLVKPKAVSLETLGETLRRAA